MKNLLILILFGALSSPSFAVDVSKIEEGPVGGLVPISLGGITIPLILVYEHNLPPAPQDDGSLGSTDSDDDGIRDDIEHYIARQYPLDQEKRGYLYHVAAYTRKIVTAPSSPAMDNIRAGVMLPHQVIYSYVESQKATNCLDTEGRTQINRVAAMNMDSRERLTAYLKNVNKFRKVIKSADDSTTCVLKNNEALKSDHTGFHALSIIDRHGYVTDGYGTTAVNKTGKFGLGINAPKRFSVSNKGGSDGALRLQVWQGGRQIKNQVIHKGQNYSFTLIHDMDYVNKEGYLEYKIDKVDGETVLFSLRIEPSI